MDENPGFPSPIGVLRAVEAPRYEAAANEQVEAIVSHKGAGDLGTLLRAGDTWEVKE
jgi:2-oxoglutarate ferredoxin oxidoreductase subunit beta